jgi:hypothetical protein
MLILEEVVPNDMLLEQDSSSAFLYCNSGGTSWIVSMGIDSPVAWLPCSPGLKPLDFFFWGYIKDAVYVPPLPPTLAELAGGI